jgi:peptidase E
LVQVYQEPPVTSLTVMVLPMAGVESTLKVNEVIVVGGLART